MSKVVKVKFIGELFPIPLVTYENGKSEFLPVESPLKQVSRMLGTVQRMFPQFQPRKESLDFP